MVSYSSSPQGRWESDVNVTSDCECARLKDVPLQSRDYHVDNLVILDVVLLVKKTTEQLIRRLFDRDIVDVYIQERKFYLQLVMLT